MISIEDILISKLELKEDEIDETKQIIKNSIVDNRIKFIEDYGFFTWSEVYKNNQKYVYIENMYIEPEKRKYNNLLSIRKFLRDKYLSDVVFFYWHNGRKDKFFYVKGW